MMSTIVFQVHNRCIFAQIQIICCCFLKKQTPSSIKKIKHWITSSLTGWWAFYLGHCEAATILKFFLKKARNKVVFKKIGTQQ